MQTITNSILVHEAINDDYEWIQYNNKLRLIRSIKDDMFQMKSIIAACHSNKLPKDWFDNQSTRELLSQFQAEKGSGGIPLYPKSHENRDKLPNHLKGYYVNRLLVNAVAMWASPRYALDIFILLDKIASQEREKLEHKIEEQKPRMVPKNKEKNYKYLIWQEPIEDKDEMVLLHLVRRNNRSFSDLAKIKNDPEKCWLFVDKLPIAMTPNEDIKDLIKKTLPGSDYVIKACKIEIKKCHLQLVHDKIINYFNNFQK